MWCARKPPITPEAVRLVGGRIATYRGQWQVIAMPVRSPARPDDDPVGWVILPLNGKTLPAYSENGSVTWVKIKTMPGTQPGLIGHFAGGATIVKTEGPTDALALLSQGPADFEDVVCNVHGAKEDPRKVAGLADYFSAKDVIIVHDADEAGESGATYVEERPGWAPFAAEHAANCKHIRLPYEIKTDHGNDLRDYFYDGYTRADFDHLVAEAAPFDKPTMSTTSAIESDDDPHKLARMNLARYAAANNGATIRNWRDEWYTWKGNRYRKIPNGEMKAKLNMAIKSEFDRLNIDEQANSQKEVKAVRKVTKPLVSNVLDATKGMTLVPSHVELGTWLNDQARIRERRNYVAMENGILDVDSLLADSDDVIIPHSPAWFSTVRLPYRFDSDAECPIWNDFLQYNLEDDQERIAILQEWAGYCLLPDTGQQKFLLLEGEGANGKSVCFAAIEAMLGTDNVSHVPLEIFGDRFSKSQTLGKLANISPDAGEIDKQAEGTLKSFTAGERMMFDRKGIAPIEAYPTARLMIGCNNRPRFSDKSDGIWRRMILIPFRVTIPVRKRIKNMDKCWWWERSGELPGIFWWAIKGLDRLLQQGGFTHSTVCDQSLKSYRDELNPAGVYLAERYIEDPSITEKNTILQPELVYDKYKFWCSQNGFATLSITTFGREVFRKFPSVTKIRKQEGNFRTYRYVGLRELNANDELGTHDRAGDAHTSNQEDEGF